MTKRTKPSLPPRHVRGVIQLGGKAKPAPHGGVIPYLGDVDKKDADYFDDYICDALLKATPYSNGDFIPAVLIKYAILRSDINGNLKDFIKMVREVWEDLEKDGF